MIHNNALPLNYLMVATIKTLTFADLILAIIYMAKESARGGIALSIVITVLWFLSFCLVVFEVGYLIIHKSQHLVMNNIMMYSVVILNVTIGCVSQILAQLYLNCAIPVENIVIY